jgi:site-specific DNA-methyltransferase (adenine-specific)
MSPLPRNTILIGDALQRLRELPSSSIDTVITSPPFFNLRDYQVEGQLGQEAGIDEWVARLRAVLLEIARVVKPTGSVWLDLGDSYSAHRRYGAPAKGQLLGPERLLLALHEDGWICRNKVVWSKTNPMPCSVRDRLNTTYEVVYFLVRSGRYFFNLDAIREPHVSQRRPTPVYRGTPRQAVGLLTGGTKGLVRVHAEGRHGHPLGKNPGDVWRIAGGHYRGAHFATFPERLIRRPLLASCPERVCMACGKPWERRDRALRPGCECRARFKPGIVLDPFFGTGTVGLVARDHGRHWLGIELSPVFAELAAKRLGISGGSFG